MSIPVALTIAGSDSGGGAGIQADLRTFDVLGVHGACAITSVTSQNTGGVTARLDLPAHTVVSQIEAVLSDLDVGGTKTGMLANAGIVRVVAEVLAEHGVGNLVVDPVAVATSGHRLLDEGGLEAMREVLLPMATVLTPNLVEASALLDRKIEDLEGMKEAARSLQEMGAQCVLVKGGHLGGGEAIDVFYNGEDLLELTVARITAKGSHGTGCVLSAAITGRLALGESPKQAVIRAKEDLTQALRHSLELGGVGWPVHPRR